MELEQIILRMDELKAQLDVFRPLSEDRLNRLRQKLKLEWNYHSNSIEGNTLTKSETKSFLLSGITAKGKPFRDYLEMKGHNEALNRLFEIVSKDVKITEKLIQDFHELILVEPYIDKEAEINPGKWKKLPNYLITRTGERIDFASPENVPRLMSHLVNWLNNHLDPPKRKKKKYQLHPLLIASGFHVEFVKIHPFGDGNGRMARIIVNLILMQSGFVPAIINLKDRENYFDALNLSSLNEPEPLAKVIGKRALKSLELALKAAKGESIEDEEDLDKQLELLNQKLDAKIKAIPIRADKKVVEILEITAFPFFERLQKDLSKFDGLFQSSVCEVSTNKFQIIEPFSEKNLNEISEWVNESFKYLRFNYRFSDLKKLTEEKSIEVGFRFEFNRGGFVIEGASGINKQFKYNQKVSEKEQNDWIKSMQKMILEKVNEFIESDS